MTEQTAISAEVQLNAGDMYRYWLTTLFRRFRWLVVLFSVLALYLIFQFSRGDFHWEWSFGNLFAPLFFFIILPYAFFVAPFLSSKKYLQRNPILAGPITYTFSSDGIDVTTSQSRSHVNWDAIVGALETSAQFLLYPQTAFAYVIPKRAFSAPEDLSAFRDLVGNQVRNARLKRS